MLDRERRRLKDTELKKQRAKSDHQVLMTRCQFPVVDFGWCVGDIKSNLENKQGSLFANYLAVNLPALTKQYNH